MTSSSGPYSSFSSSTDFNIGSDLSFDQAVDFGKSLGLDSTTFQELEGIDFSQSFFDPDLAQIFGGSSTEQKQLPPPGPPAAPPNGDYVFDNDYPYIRSQFSKNLFGGNLDVISTLQNIDFDPNVDGSLRNAIAYIQPWTRLATSGKTQAGNSPESVPVDDSLNSLLSNVWDNLDLFKDADLPSIDPSLLGTYDISNGFPSFNADKSIWETSNFNYFNDLDLGSYSDFKGKTFSSELYDQFSSDGGRETSNAQLKQDSLKVDNATSTLAPIVPSLGSPADFEALGESIGAAVASSGPVFSGNPSGGLLAQVGNLARSFGVDAGSGADRDLSSSQPKSSSLAGQPIGSSSGKWQFLFNPSQLTLSVGPNFKAAETWGVGDEPNAGQPLHWTSYKNPELKFSKVLLNGYVFGRRVEELEQGLIKLFMENPTNDAKHGPRVLEFVWGKKTFGPCIIKDVRINQKMWDEGLLVNAEVDFTLVRVPEWTINDGYVSTYDPSAQNTIKTPQSGLIPNRSGNVGVGSSSPSDGRETPAPPPAPEEEKYEPPAQTSKPICKKLATAIKNSTELLKIFDYIAQEAGRDSNPLKFWEEDISAVKGYQRAFSQYSNWLQRVQLADSTTTYPSRCGREYFGQKRTELELQPGAINGDEKKAFSKKIILEMKGCVNTVSKNPIDAYQEGNCKVFESGEKYRILG